MTTLAQRVRFPAWPRWVMIVGVVLAAIGVGGAILTVGTGWFGPGIIARLAAAPPRFLIFALVSTL
ncbi:MAG TPA: hypothetical protein VFZ25_14705, partial [Chloroflexota bacterium]|nr:hypothetical protein [Chloroflexota bacterium]